MNIFRKIFRRKKEEPEWELEAIFQFSKERLLAMEQQWATGEAPFEREELEKMRTNVRELAAMKAAWLELGRRKRVSPDTKVAASVTAVAAAAPYLIEAGGKLAPHIKGKVQLPKIWK